MLKKIFHFSLLVSASFMPLAANARQCGVASWYGPGLYGNQTANGEVFRPGTMTAAHPSLPFGSRVRVTNRDNGRSVVVRINDRGPFVGNRIIDLAQVPAQKLGFSGLADVCVSAL
jgi:rare lipoprotein A